MLLAKSKTYNLRVQLCQVMYDLMQQGMNKGSSGNASCRVEGGFLITPSALSPLDMKPEDIVFLNFDGEILEGKKPSSEWRFHKDIYLSRPEVGGIVHTHSMYSTTLACMHKDIPSFHYMIAMAGGDSIRCAPYALFGSQELSNYAIEALRERWACLLANHGLIALGENLKKAYDMSIEVENLSEQYWRLLQTDNMHILSSSQMLEVIERFKTYK
ncbi:MAG: class II aldolase [Gammaproteobacteria bacterium]|nr:class II aldolase [Gammaproteobacteria bacterium]